MAQRVLVVGGRWAGGQEVAVRVDPWTGMSGAREALETSWVGASVGMQEILRT